MRNIVYYYIPKKTFNLFNHEELKRVKYIFYTTILMIIFFSYAVFDKIKNKIDLNFAYLVLSSSILGVASLVILRKGKLIVSSNLTLIYIFLNIIFLIVNYKFESYLSLYRYTFFMMAFLFISSLISVKSIQVLISGSVLIILLIITYFSKIKPNLVVEEIVRSKSTFSISFVSFLLLTVVAYEIYNFSNELIKEANRERDLNMMKFDKLNKLIQNSSEIIGIGNNLVSSSEVCLSSIIKSNSELESINKKSLELKIKSKNIVDSMKAIVDNITYLADKINEQATSIEETSSALLEITSNINQINLIIKNRQENIKDLNYQFKQNKELLIKIKNNMENFLERSEKLLQISKVIVDIADQTNVLAMNASIEASHAGEYGKGFMVVADEIRKLADKTSKNANSITEDLEQNNEFIINFGKLNKEVLNFFENLENEINNLNNGFDEITNGVNEINLGISDISKASQILVRITNDIKSFSKNVEIEVTEGKKNINDIDNSIEDIKNSIEKIFTEFKQIEDIIKSIKEIGDDNIKNIEKLTLDIEKINKIEI
ncbi:MAG: methyl-accepting chemotaxis protein [Spirochaetes bacterium]|nr:methyl-accepting chemotaxis protein [Spirochaetota bacterium]